MAARVAKVISTRSRMSDTVYWQPHAGYKAPVRVHDSRPTYRPPREVRRRCLARGPSRWADGKRNGATAPGDSDLSKDTARRKANPQPSARRSNIVRF